jgi:hypothetical protein
LRPTEFLQGRYRLYPNCSRNKTVQKRHNLREVRPEKERIMDLGPRTVAPAASVARTQKVECWVYNNSSVQKTASNRGEIAEGAIARWLSEPAQKSMDNKVPVAGLRLVFHKHYASMSRPFGDTTFRAINSVLGLPERHAYLTMMNAGACGKYMVAAGKPGEFLFDSFCDACFYKLLPGLGEPGLTYEKVFIYHRSNNNSTISTVLKYDSATNNHHRLCPAGAAHLIPTGV